MGAPYKMIYDGDHFIDGTDHESLEAAICDAQDTLLLWQMEELRNWKYNEETNHYEPTQEQIESWDYMIYNMGCYVVEGENGIDDAVWPRTDADYEEVGWMPWEELAKRCYQ